MRLTCERCGREDVAAYNAATRDNVVYVDLSVGTWRRIRYLCGPCARAVSGVIDEWLSSRATATTKEGTEGGG